MPRRDGIKRELVGSTAPAAASLPLTGAEVLHAVRGTQSFVVTTADIAALGIGGGGGGTPSDTAPAALGATAAAGTATAYSRGDHVHPRPTAAQVGALAQPAAWASAPPADYFLIVTDGAGGVIDTIVSLNDLGNLLGSLAINPVITITDLDSPFSITEAVRNHVIRVDASNGPVELIANSSLYSNGSPGGAFECTIDVASVANEITLTPTGGLLINSIPLTSLGACTFVVTSPTSASLFGAATEAGGLSDLAQTLGALYLGVNQNALDALAPAVQATHTAATRIIVEADAGDIVPVSAASNAVAITIPAALFGVLEADRAFVFQVRALSVAGGALTFVGGGGLVLTYYGKNPGTTPYAAGDWITVAVDSATTASIFCASPAA